MNISGAPRTLLYQNSHLVIVFRQLFDCMLSALVPTLLSSTQAGGTKWESARRSASMSPIPVGPSDDSPGGELLDAVEAALGVVPPHVRQVESKRPQLAWIFRSRY